MRNKIGRSIEAEARTVASGGREDGALLVIKPPLYKTDVFQIPRPWRAIVYRALHLVLEADLVSAFI